MFLLPLMNILAQSLAALVIFVVGYLLLLVCVIAGLVVTHLIYKGARLFWSHVVARTASAHAATSGVAETADAHFPQNDILLAPPALNRR